MVALTTDSQVTLRNVLPARLISPSGLMGLKLASVLAV